ncbi:transcriptional regulator [Streptomyces sp. NPDC052496]|uniref:winged helix-turn-helix domain-containing protein n=1 Tax=Streptomyces sp. NPDC052496 TaxID=3154951 RepID=UPI00344471F1
MTAEAGPAGPRGSHPRHALVPLLNSPVRLSVVAALAPVDRAEFAVVRDLVEVPDSALSKQTAALEAAGWVAVAKGRAGRRPLTWLALTAEGRAVYQRHLAALRAIAAGCEEAQLSGFVSPSCHHDGHEHT